MIESKWIAWVTPLVLGAVLLGGCKNSRTAQMTCTPGSRLEIACGEGCGLGTCSGDPVLEICSGARSSCSSGDLGSNDDACGGLCPGLTVTCPAEGVITVAPRAFSGGSFRCDWALRVLSGPGAPLLEADAGR